jgi:hypothetical protein
MASTGKSGKPMHSSDSFPVSRAFLYYFTSPDKPRIAGELRFRVASSDDPASFESGSDLLKPNGQPWSRPLYVLSKYYTPLYEKLREDRLVPDDLDAVLSTSFPPPFPKYRRSQLLYTLNDVFILDFSFRGLRFFVITEQGMKRLRMHSPIFDSRVNFRRGGTPYTGAHTNYHLSINNSNESVGSALARFERSTLPEHRHKDCRVTLSQDNHTCEMCDTLLRWLYCAARERRASSDI